MTSLNNNTKKGSPILPDNQILRMTIDIFLWICLFPILLPIGLFFYAYKFILLYFVSKYRKDLTPISPNDLIVARATIDKKEIVDIGFILQVNGDISQAELQKKFQEHFLSKNDLEDRYKTLSCTFEMLWGYLFLKRVDNFRVDNNIREDLLGFGNSPQDYFSTWLHSPYQNDKAPRWELLLLKSEDKRISYVAFRMHHGLIDGFGMLLIVDKLCGQKSPYLVDTEPPLSFQDKVSMLLELPRRVVEYNHKALRSSMPFPEMTNLDKTDKMLVSWATLDLPALKSIRRQLGVSFSTLLYVLQTGALRRHLIETGRKSEITETLPVFHTIPRANHPLTRFTNHWSYVKLHTPFANVNPLERVWETEGMVQEFLKNKLNVMSLEFFISFLNLLPTRYCLLNLKMPMSVYKASLSSMVRANSQYVLLGNKVTNIYHTFCTKDLCPVTVLYTTTASHNNQIDITLSAAKQLVRNQTEMNRMAEKHFKDELQDLINKCQMQTI